MPDSKPSNDGVLEPKKRRKPPRLRSDTELVAIDARIAQMPSSCRAVYRRAVKGKSQAAAIKAFCLECVGWARAEVTSCTAPACPLFMYRPFRGKDGKNGTNGIRKI